jgi:quinol-cytochrome oxidoreductase complex cytochrome b subunit
VNWLRGAILLAWTLFVILVTGAALFFFTYGDCDSEACSRIVNRNFAIIAGSAFVIYWLVFLALVRRWNR